MSIKGGFQQKNKQTNKQQQQNKWKGNFYLFPRFHSRSLFPFIISKHDVFITSKEKTKQLMFELYNASFLTFLLAMLLNKGNCKAKAEENRPKEGTLFFFHEVSLFTKNNK